MKSLFILLAFTGLIHGCGGTAGSTFHPEFPDNREGQMRAVETRLTAAPASPEASALVALTADSGGSALIAYDLEARSQLWSSPVVTRDMPWIAGDTVITLEGTDIVGRALRTGAVLFSFPHRSLGLVGAAGQGSLSVICLSTGGGVGARSRVIAMRGGSMLWSTELEQAVGRPAVAAGMAFIPWATQNLTVIDIDAGRELARFRTAEQVVGHALHSEGSVFLGQERLALLSAAMADETTHGDAFVGVIPSDLPGRPTFLFDAYQPPPVVTSAVHRIRADWSPESRDGRAASRNDLVYISFYKVVLALRAESNELQWSAELASDIVGAAATPSGLITADTNGTLQFLSSTNGNASWSHSLGHSLRYAAIRPGRFTEATADNSAAPAVVDQLVSVIQNRDNRLVPARVLAVQLLSRLDGADTTGHIIDVCDDERLPESVRDAACMALASRESGEASVMAALNRRASFLQSVGTPPVGALAQAAARMQLRAAVPLLVAHLANPETREADLAPLLVALRELADPAATESVRDFILLYHADQGGEHLGLALGEAARTLVALEGPVASEVLEFVKRDFFTRTDLLGVANTLLGEMAGNPSTDTDTNNASETPDTDPDQDATPAFITQGIVDRVLEPVRGEILACLQSAPGYPQSARLIIVLDGFGGIEALRVLPPGLSECVEPLVRQQTFPGNRGRQRQQVTYTVRR